MASDATRYRYKTPTKRGRWVATRELAREAAVKAGVAHKDEDDDQIYLDVMTEIEAE